MVDYYKGKNVVRYTMIISKENKQHLVNLAADYGMSQMKAIELLVQLAVNSRELIDPVFEANRGNRSGMKHASKRGILKMVNQATPEQLAEIQRILAGVTENESPEDEA